MRDQPIRLLEIGVGGYDTPTWGGSSLRMWRDYFRRGLVHGLEVLFDDYLRPGGFYAIEDTHTAYDPDFGGGPIGHPGTSVELIKQWWMKSTCRLSVWLPSTSTAA